MHGGRKFWDDLLVLLDSKGKELKRLSIYQALRDADLLPVSFSGGEFNVDPFHANTVRVIEHVPKGASGQVQAGSILIALKNMGAVFLLDPESWQVVWSMDRGQDGIMLFSGLHQPRINSSGHILLFDNAGGYKGKSSVRIVDPASQTVVWSYSGPDEKRLASSFGGGCQQLPNGNILVVDSEQGRALEVTPKKKLVWSFQNIRDASTTPPSVGVLPSLLRLDRSTPLGWLGNKIGP